MLNVASIPKAIAASDGESMALYQLHKVYDGSDRYGVFNVYADGSLHDIGIRFDGELSAILKLFELWACENLPAGRIVEYVVPRKRGVSEDHASRRALHRAKRKHRGSRRA